MNDLDIFSVFPFACLGDQDYFGTINDMQSNNLDINVEKFSLNNINDKLFNQFELSGIDYNNDGPDTNYFDNFKHSINSTTYYLDTDTEKPLIDKIIDDSTLSIYVHNINSIPKHFHELQYFLII